MRFDEVERSAEAIAESGLARQAEEDMADEETILGLYLETKDELMDPEKGALLICCDPEFDPDLVMASIFAKALAAQQDGASEVAAAGSAVVEALDLFIARRAQKMLRRRKEIDHLLSQWERESP